MFNRQAHNKAYYQKRKLLVPYDPARQRRSVLLHRYKITPEQYDAMFAKQGEMCAICYSKTPAGKNWHIDHCHLTNKVRGILCCNCNTGLGKFKDCPEFLEFAAIYIRKHRG